MTHKLPLIITATLAMLLFVRTPLPAEDRFTDNGDGTLSDHELGLMWSKTDNQGDVTWQDAKLWARFTFPTTLTAPSDDWRLPSTEELASLHNSSSYYDGYDADCGVNVRVVKDFNLSCAWVWASEDAHITARLYDFRTGQAYMDRKAKNHGYRALAVRPLPPVSETSPLK